MLALVVRNNKMCIQILEYDMEIMDKILIIHHCIYRIQITYKSDNICQMSYRLFQMSSRQIDVLSMGQQNISQLQMCPSFNSGWRFEIENCL